MTFFRLLLGPDERLDIGHAVQLLKSRFPSATVEGDTFERKRRKLSENLAEMLVQGDPIRNPEMFYQVLARSEAETGPGLDVCFVVDDAVKFTGSVLTAGISLTSSDQLPNDIVKQIEEYLLSFNIGRVIFSNQSPD